MRHICVLGTSCLDRVIVPRLNPVFDFTKTTQITETESFGGSMHNIAYHLGLLVNGVSFYTKIGNDSLSQKLIDELREANCQVQATIVNGPCPVFTCLEDQNGKIYLSSVDERYFFNETDKLETSDFDDFAFGITDNNNEVFFKHLMSISKNTKWIMNARPVKKEWLPLLDGYILNRDEASRYGYESLETFANSFLEAGLNWLIVTLDKDGLVYFDKEKTKHFKPLTGGKGLALGCGDAFSAGLLYGRSLGLDVYDAIPYGLKASAIIYKKTTATSKDIIQIKE